MLDSMSDPVSESDPMNNDTDYVSPGTAALRLRVNPRTVARWADSGRFGEIIVSPSGFRRISAAAVEQLAAELAEGAA